MTTERNSQGVDGLAEVMRLIRAADAMTADCAEDLPVITAAVVDAEEAAVNYLRSHGEAWAELLAAIVESRRAATQAFANDGQPANWIRYEESEERLDAALAKFPEPRP